MISEPRTGKVPLEAVSPDQRRRSVVTTPQQQHWHRDPLEQLLDVPEIELVRLLPEAAAAGSIRERGAYRGDLLRARPRSGSQIALDTRARSLAPGRAVQAGDRPTRKGGAPSTAIGRRGTRRSPREPALVLVPVHRPRSGGRRWRHSCSRRARHGQPRLHRGGGRRRRLASEPSSRRGAWPTSRVLGDRARELCIRSTSCGTTAAKVEASPGSGCNKTTAGPMPASTTCSMTPPIV